MEPDCEFSTEMEDSDLSSAIGEDNEMTDVLDENYDLSDALDENSELSDAVDENSEPSNAEESNINSDVEDEPVGNAMWADAMAKVLGTRTSDKVLLTKAKKDYDKPKRQTKTKGPDFQIITDDGHVMEVKDEEQPKQKKSRKESIEKKAKKQLWENMCRCKPDISQREMERTLMKIATKGVVQLFNAVEKHQKKPKAKISAKSKKSSVKGSFMDMLKGNICPKTEGDNVQSEAPKKEPWSVLKEDFMMGASLKDWDKNDDDDDEKE